MTQKDFDYQIEVKEPPSFFKDADQTLVNGEESFFNKFDKGFKHNYLLMVISYFNGSDLFHVFGRLSKEIREELPSSGLLDQEKSLRVR
jgi:hypothetical protein